MRCCPEARLKEACVDQVWKRIGVRHQLKKLTSLSPQRRRGAEARRTAHEEIPSRNAPGFLLGLPLGMFWCSLPSGSPQKRSRLLVGRRFRACRPLRSSALSASSSVKLFLCVSAPLR